MFRNSLWLGLFGILAYIVVDIVAREAILHGNKAEKNQLKYQVALVIAGQGPTCGGGIIGDHHVLTAANCVIDKNADLVGEPISVLAATVDFKQPGIIADVETVIVPSDYKPLVASTTGDIAVLKLNKSLDLEKNHHLIQLRLPSRYDQLHEGRHAMIAGFGWTWVEVNGLKQNGGYNDSHLRYAEASVLDQHQCEISHPSLRLTKKHLCARVTQWDANQPRGVCIGDGGGPLVYAGRTVIGIFSLGKVGCSEQNSSAVYTRVSQYPAFIRNAMEGTVTYNMHSINVHNR